MSYNVRTTHHFEREAKPLLKKYASLSNEKVITYKDCPEKPYFSKATLVENGYIYFSPLFPYYSAKKIKE